MNGRDRAGAAAERVRERLAPARAKRLDAISRACNTADDLGEDEITGRFAALAEDAIELAKIQARQSRPEIVRTPLPPAVRRLRRVGRVALAIAGGLAGLGALAKLVLHWF